MKITIIYDNTVFRDGLKSDWGFSALIEFNNRKILFDTGGNGAILLKNMRKLNINPKSIDTIFISHNHFDHVGGLSEFLNKNNDVKLYAPSTFRGVKNVRELEYITNSKELSKNIYTTGELDNIEQSLILNTRKDIDFLFIIKLYLLYQKSKLKPLPTGKSCIYLHIINN